MIPILVSRHTDTAIAVDVLAEYVVYQYPL